MRRSCPSHAALKSGSCATEIREPCQGRNAAALSGSFRVPRDSLGRAGDGGNVRNMRPKRGVRILSVQDMPGRARKRAACRRSSEQVLFEERYGVPWGEISMAPCLLFPGMQPGAAGVRPPHRAKLCGIRAGLFFAAGLPAELTSASGGNYN